MAPVPNPAVIFNEIPEGEPTENTLIVDDKQQIDLDQPLNGGYILQLVCCSLDPYMRGRMRDPKIPSYIDAFELHKPIKGWTVAKVVKSEFEGLKEGDHVYASLPYQKYILQLGPPENPSVDRGSFMKLANKENLPWTAYVGAAGMPGKTAYMAWKEIAEAKEGETVYVSSGAGPVGQLVIQIAKSEGLKVIASAGSEEKVHLLKEIGADVAFNYKTTDAKKVFEEYGPLDIDWINVGGQALEDEIEYMNTGGRLIACGMIAGYNTGTKTAGVRNLFKFVSKRLKMQGFIVFDFEEKWNKKFYEEVPPKLATGEYKFKETLYDGFENVPRAFREMLNGTAGLGKVAVRLE